MLKDKIGVQPTLREEFKGLPIPNIADLAGGANLADTVAKVNAILAALRTSGLMK